MSELVSGSLALVVVDVVVVLEVLPGVGLLLVVELVVDEVVEPLAVAGLVAVELELPPDPSEVPNVTGRERDEPELLPELAGAELVEVVELEVGVAVVVEVVVVLVPSVGLLQPCAGSDGDLLKSCSAGSVTGGFSLFFSLDFFDFFEGFSVAAGVAGFASLCVSCHISSRDPVSWAFAKVGAKLKLKAKRDA